jgi:hypothetical protein
MREMLPVLLIGLGTYLIINKIRDGRAVKSTVDALPENSLNLDEQTYRASSVAQFRAKRFSD